MTRYLDYREASAAARRKATTFGMNVSLRKTVEFGRVGYTVGFAERFGEQGETIRPGEPLSQAELDAEAKATK